jgi:hypothetical protein
VQPHTIGILEMNVEKASHWFSLIANAGVLIGIFAVALELNQASRLSEANAYQTRSSEITTSLVELALSEDLAIVLVKLDEEGVSSLSPTELRRARAWNSAVIRRMQSQYYQYEQGFLETEVVDETFDIIVSNAYDLWKELDILDTIENSAWLSEIELRVNLEDRQD